eukprot:UN06912
MRKTLEYQWYPKFSRESLILQLSNDMSRMFWIARTEIISENKMTPNKVSEMTFFKFRMMIII